MYELPGPRSKQSSIREPGDRPLRVARELQVGTVWINDWALIQDGFEEGGLQAERTGTVERSGFPGRLSRSEACLAAGRRNEELKRGSTFVPKLSLRARFPRHWYAKPQLQMFSAPEWDERIQSAAGWAETT